MESCVYIHLVLLIHVYITQSHITFNLTNTAHVTTISMCCYKQTFIVCIIKMNLTVCITSILYYELTYGF